MSWFPSLRAIGGTRGTGPKNKANSLTLSELKLGPSRLIESFPYDYGKILSSSTNENGFLETPFDADEKNKRVIIIGCGMSGLLAARELLRAGLNVHMYERGILFQEDNNWVRYHYGRACSDYRKFSTESVVCELGGMRFPEKAKATWQFFSEAFNDNQNFESFPNPGIVPTSLLDNQNSYLWQSESIEHPELPANFKRIANDVSIAMNGIIDEAGTSTTIAQDLLNQEYLSISDENKLRNFWEYVVKKFDNTTFGSWIHDYVEIPCNWSQDDLSIFFNLGFGTGGMGSLFPVGFLEMYRIWVWDYANEYSLPPGKGLGGIANTILEKLKSKYGPTGSGQLIVSEQHEVQGIGYLSEDTLIESSERIPAVLVSDLKSSSKSLIIDKADYIITAIPHTALISILSFTTNRSYPRNTNKHHYDAPDGKKYYFESYYGKNSPDSAIKKFITPLKNAISKLNMVNSTKTFYTFKTPPWSSPILDWETIDSKPVQCVLHDGWPRASYFLQSQDTTKGPVVALFSYAWNLDSNKVKAIKDIARTYEFKNDSTGTNITEQDIWFGSDYSDEWWRAYRTAAAVIPGLLKTGGNSTERGKVTEFFSSITNSTQKFDATGIDWQDEPGLSGGFKLDAAGDFQTSNALSYSYLSSINNELGISPATRVYQKIYFASDSASNYGGWVEGALMAGTNSAIGILAHINKSKLKSEPASLLNGNPFSKINKLIPTKPYNQLN